MTAEYVKYPMLGSNIFLHVFLYVFFNENLDS